MMISALFLLGFFLSNVGQHRQFLSYKPGFKLCIRARVLTGMYCNTCFVSLRPGEQAVAISCGHLCCPMCFQSIVSAQRCSVCAKVR